VLILVAAGCANPWTGAGERPAGDVAAATAFWQPHLLYTSPHPYPKLFIEVDSIAGAEPAADDLDALRSFAASACDKPGGVTLERSDVIPRAVVKNRLPASVALQFIDGPPDSRSAFLYVLYWDSRVMAGRRSNPDAKLLPYPCAIFIDRRYDPMGMVSRYGEAILTHEAAHLFGLTRERSHGDGIHCTNAGCVMNAALEFDVWKSLRGTDPGHQRALCHDCDADLSANRRRSPPGNLRFLGPAMVRNEDGYAVVSLPGFVYVNFRGTAPLTLDTITPSRQRAIGGLSTDGSVYWTGSLDAGSVEAAMRALSTAAQDPYDLIREIAAQLTREVQAGAE
jgi:hypothetical protein